MKKPYTSPELEIVSFKLVDILGTSTDNVGPGQIDEPLLPGEGGLDDGL